MENLLRTRGERYFESKRKIEGPSAPLPSVKVVKDYIEAGHEYWREQHGVELSKTSGSRDTSTISRAFSLRSHFEKGLNESKSGMPIDFCKREADFANIATKYLDLDEATIRKFKALSKRWQAIAESL